MAVSRCVEVVEASTRSFVRATARVAAAWVAVVAG